MWLISSNDCWTTICHIYYIVIICLIHFNDSVCVLKWLEFSIELLFCHWIQYFHHEGHVTYLCSEHTWNWFWSVEPGLVSNKYIIHHCSKCWFLDTCLTIDYANGKAMMLSVDVEGVKTWWVCSHHWLVHCLPETQLTECLVHDMAVCTVVPLHNILLCLVMVDTQAGTDWYQIR